MKNFKDFVENETLSESTKDDFLKELFKLIVKDPREVESVQNGHFSFIENYEYKFDLNAYQEVEVDLPGLTFPPFAQIKKVDAVDYFWLTLSNTKVISEHRGIISPSGFEMDYEGEKLKYPINADVKKYLNFVKYFNNKNTIDVCISRADSKEQVEKLCPQIVDLIALGGKSIKEYFDLSKASDLLDACKKYIGFYELLK